jgi:hypothetical protein
MNGAAHWQPATHDPAQFSARYLPAEEIHLTPVNLCDQPEIRRFSQVALPKEL